MRDLSILIPARNEEFLKNTISDILKNIEADTEVIAALDGQWANPPVGQHDRVNLIYVNPAIGQRAAQNLACRLSRAKYVMKLDAHCSFDKGFDRKMLEAFKKVDDNVVMLPVMRNLWAYDWKCYKCGKRIYQDKKPKCPVCGHKMKKKMLWIGKKRPQSDSYCFNAKPTFAYFGEYRKRPEYKKDKEKRGLTETMSIQGSCFMCLRKLYWNWNLCDETLGNWGHQGIEVACKTWLKGGRALVNHKTWYAHMFRTKSATFGFPWPASGRDQRKVKEKVWKLIMKGLPGQKHPVSWLVEKFWPVKGWTDKDLKELKVKEAKETKFVSKRAAKLPSFGVIFSSQTKAGKAESDHLGPNNKVSFISPSRGRPDELLISLNSLGLAKSGLELLVWLDRDDPKLARYQELFGSNPNVKLFVKKRVGYKNFHVMMNFLASQASFDWIFLWNDDGTMVNPDWFQIFKDFVKQFEPTKQPVVLNIWGEGKTTKNLFPIVSRSYFDILGHFSLSPSCDFWAQLVSINANIAYDLKGIKPRHRKGSGDNELIDQTYKEVIKAGKESRGQWNPRRNGTLKRLLKQDIKKIIQYKK